MNTATPKTSAPRHAVVIGAGLAGAAVCSALAHRGWRLTLIDQAPGPAQAASALPVGMLSPHVTKAPTPLSRLSELGVSSMRTELDRLLPQGRGWQACEVDNLGHDPGRWPAALIRPSALVQAWLQEASATVPLTTRWNTRADRLERDPTRQDWLVMDANQRLITRCDVVVLASAYDSQRLLQATMPGLDQVSLPLRPVKGQMSLAPLQGDPLASLPRRNKGIFVPEYQDREMPGGWPQRFWCMGSTYRRGENDDRVTDEDHRQNLLSLRTLCPVAAEHMRRALDSGGLLGWAQVRCASLDRLPLVGAVPDVAALQTLTRQVGFKSGRFPLAAVPRCSGLYMLCALGSRGLTLAHWCAHALAAQMQGDAPESQTGKDADLVRALDPARFAWKQARRQVR